MPKRTFARNSAVALAVVGVILAMIAAHNYNRLPATTTWPAAHRITHALQSEFARLPGVRAAEVDWSPGNFTNPADCDVYIVLKPGAVVGNIENVVIKSVWLSKLAPLDGISVTINRLPGPVGVGFAVVTTNCSWLHNDVAKLTREFGPRPTTP